MSYARYSGLGGGSGGVSIYPTFADFPVSAPIGTIAVAADSGIVYEFTFSGWVAIAAPGDALSLGAFGSTPNADGLSIASNVLSMQPADATHPGGVSTSTQTFAGNKTFSGSIGASNLSGTNTGDVTIGTANGLSLSSQALSLSLSSTTTTGALSSTDWNTFNNKQSTITIGNLTDVGTDGIIVTGGTGSVIGSGTSIAQHVADSSHNGYLSSSDWSTFNSKQSSLTFGNLTDTGTDGLTITGGTGSVIGSGTSIAQHVADSTHNGYLLSTDWSTFNGKQSALTIGNLTDVGTDGITITGGTGSIIGSGTAISQHVADTTHNGYLSSADWNTFNGKGSGTVTSIAMTVPSFLSVSGSPITGSGTFGLTLSGTAIPTTSGGTGISTTYTSGSVIFADSSGFLNQDNSKFFWDDTNFQLSLGGHLHTAALGISQAGGSSVGFDLTTTTANTALQVENQGAQIAANFTTAANSASQGGTVVLGASRGTNASRTASTAADQIGVLAAQSYNGSSFGPGYTGAVVFVATENQTSSHNGGQIVIATTANTTLAPVSAATFNQDQTIQLNHYTTNGFVKFTSANGTLGVDTNSYVVVNGALGTPSSGTLTSATGLPIIAGTTGTLTVARGGTGNTSVITAPTASTIAGWDVSSNFSANNFIEGFTSTATAAATTTLTLTSTYTQVFTGTTTQTVKLPVVTTLANSYSYQIMNLSTGLVTVQSSGSNVLQAMASNTVLIATVTNAAGGTGTASWSWTYQAINSSIAVSTAIAAQITGAAGTTTTTNPIIFPTVTNDTNSAYNASTGQYTVPSAGYYNIGVSFRAGSGFLVNIYAYINGTQSTSIGYVSSIDGDCVGTGLFKLNLNDTIDIRPVGGTVAGMASDSTYSIFKVT